MTRTAAADAVLPACPPTAAAYPAGGTAVTPAGSVRLPALPDRARPPLVRPCPGLPYPPRSGRAGPPHRHLHVGTAVMLAGWPADPGRGI
jgi:hypothetical protein